MSKAITAAMLGEKLVAMSKDDSLGLSVLDRVNIRDGAARLMMVDHYMNMFIDSEQDDDNLDTAVRHFRTWFVNQVANQADMELVQREAYWQLDAAIEQLRRDVDMPGTHYWRHDGTGEVLITGPLYDGGMAYECDEITREAYLSTYLGLDDL